MEIYKFLASGPSLRPSDVLQIDTSPNKVKPGISDFSDDPTQVEAYMNPLLESAKQTIPEDKQVSTPIFLLVTACMRLLPEDQADGHGHGRLKEITLANLQNGFKLGWTLDGGLFNTSNADE